MGPLPLSFVSCSPFLSFGCSPSFLQSDGTTLLLNGNNSGSSLPNLVSNFQDLSAVLSLFAADTVEKKFSSPKANDWERMSTTWSVFGIMGAVRAYVKVISGVHAAEKAGVEIYDLGGYTSQRTKQSQCTCLIGQLGPGAKACWQDDRHQLLGEVNARDSRWKRPFLVAMGYSRCPFTGRKAFREVLGRVFTGIITIVIPCLPLIVLRQSLTGDTLDNATLGTAIVGSLASGCILPILLQALNPVGTAHLRDLNPSHFKNVLQDGDTVITSKMSSTIYWQSSSDELPSRSGDLPAIRLLATLAACTNVATYIFNYLELGRVEAWRAYVWLGVQSAILALRFILWAVQPRLLANRSKTVLFFVTGSLFTPLEADAKTSSCTLNRDVVHYAVASARSKILNLGGVVGNISLDALDHLSSIAPADILLAQYRNLNELVKEGGEMKAIRLPWSWMEEIYAAQGVILGRNPWALGGLYLAAVVQRTTTESPWQFKGLTTVHPSGADADRTHGEDTLSRLVKSEDTAMRNIMGITVDNYGIRDSLVMGDIVQMEMPLNHNLMDWHNEFRDNVRDCRLMAVSNGPTHLELHARNFGEGELGTRRVSKTVPTIEDMLELGSKIREKERRKDHSNCKEFCTIFGF